MHIAVLASFGAAQFVSPHTFTYAFDGDTNDLFFGLGRDLGQTAWVNPHTATRVAIGVFNSSDVADLGQGSLAGIVDRVYTDENRNSNSAGGYWRVDVGVGKTFAVSKYSYRCRPIGTADSLSNIGDFKFQGSADASAWTDKDTRTGVTYVTPDQWTTLTISSPAAYRYNRILHQSNVLPPGGGGNNFFFLTELQLYGVYTF